MYSVDWYLANVRNLQTKWVLLQWLKQYDAARPSIGLEYRYRVYQTVPIW